MIPFEEYVQYRNKYHFIRRQAGLLFNSRTDAHKFIRDFLKVRFPQNDYYVHQILDNDDYLYYQIYFTRPIDFNKLFIMEGDSENET